jgi:hypothetical protein
MLAAAVAFVALAALPSTANACLATSGVEELLRTADVVVTGVAVDRRPGNPIEAVVSLIFGERFIVADVEYAIEVDQVEPDIAAWGAWTGRIPVHLLGFSSCEQFLELGRRYRVGAMVDDGVLRVPFGAIEELPPLPGPQPAVSVWPSQLRVLAPVALIGFVGLMAWRRLRPSP